MKVLHLLQSNRFSGAENVVCQIFGMMKNEQSVRMAYCSRDGQISEVLEKKEIDFFPLKKNSVREVRRVMREFVPDVVHAHDITASVLAVFASAGMSCKVISHVHVNNSNMGHINLKTVLYEMTTPWLSHIFWVSQSCYDNYVFRKTIENKSEVLRNVIDKASILQACAADTNSYPYDIVFIGRLTEQKDPDRLLSVFRKVVACLPDVKIGIAGTGDLDDHARDLATRYGLERNVFFLGFMRNPLKLLSDAKVMLMTSRFEGLPMTVLEAMALGTPVVSTPVDGLKDVICNQINGYLESEDQKLVQKVVDIIKNPELRSFLSRNCVRKFNEVNDLTKYKDRILRAYCGT